MQQPMDPTIDPREDAQAVEHDPLVERLGMILDMVESRLRSVAVDDGGDDDIPADVPQFEVW